MLGGYVCVTVLSRFGLPFLASLPLAFLASAVVGLVLERLLYRRLYKASHLDQVLFSIGLTFMAVAAATWVWGPTSSRSICRTGCAARCRCWDWMSAPTGCS